MAIRSQWVNRYRQGSFRGVAFRLRGHQKEGGRRVQEHEFPQQNKSRTEDLGRKLGRFTLDLYVIGEDYFQNRDALEAALNRSGPGELIHPYLGSFEVQAGDYILTETTEEGRVARFTVKFSEAGDNFFPLEVVDSVASVAASANEMVSSANSAFVDIYDVVNTPAFVVQSAADAFTAVSNAIDKAVTLVTDPVANLTFAIRNFKAAIDDLIRKPGEMAALFSSLFADLLEEFQPTPETSSAILSQLKDVGNVVAVVPGDTPSRNKERINSDAIVSLTKDLAFASRAKAMAQILYPSAKEAIEERDDLVEQLELQAEVVANTVIEEEIVEGVISVSGGDDDLFQVNKDLQAALIQAVPQVGLAEQVSVTPKKTLPAVVIVYSLFGDIDKEQELIEQNEIEHPGFAPGGEDLEVSGG